MASLETLTLEIDGNASAATNGIASLMTSLSALGTIVNNQLGSLRSLSAVLKDIRSTASSTGAWKGIAQLSSPSTASGIRKVAKATQEFATATKMGTINADANGNLIDVYGKPIDKNLPVYTDYYKGEVAYFADAQKSLTSSTKNTTAVMSDYQKEIDSTAKSTGKAVKETQSLSEATKEIKRSQGAIAQARASTKGILSQIGRIAKVMMIRTAIRALMKVARQGLNNFYEYSKSIGSGYATALDKLSSAGAKAGNQLGAALGSLLSAVAPILNAIISLATAAASALSALFSLFSGGTTFSKATDGMNGFAKAAGGGGGAMKELLANFDEFNIITSEGGGGGGGGGSFSGFFEESPIPQWMQEWRPLLEALAFGTVGALVLPTIFDWLRKIVDLFTGGGATNLLNILKYMFKKSPDGGDLIGDDDLKVDIKGLGENAAEAAALAGSLAAAKAEIKELNNMTLSIGGLGAAATEMGVLSAAAIAAAPAIEKIVAALSALNAGSGLVGVISTLFTSLFSKLGGNTIKVKVDRKEYDDFKKEFEKWAKETKEKKLKVSFDQDEFDSFKRQLSTWLTKKLVKTIYVELDITKYHSMQISVEKWVERKDTKTIDVDLNTVTYTAKRFAIDSWVGLSATKVIGVTILTTAYEVTRKLIDAWVSATPTKRISVSFNMTEYYLTKAAIDTWVAKTETKKIEVKTEYNLWDSLKAKIADWLIDTAIKYVQVKIDAVSYASYLVTAASIVAWAAASLTKTVRVAFDQTSLNTFNYFKNQIDEWVNTSATKTITINTNYTTTGSPNITPVQTTTQENGLGWSWDNGLYWKDTGKNVLDTAVDDILKFFGFANGGFPVSGDLFIANEAGAEMVGSIGGHTAVANNDQIVEGIRQGVYDANAEQNNLLRQQNALLQSILEKDSSVRIGASAALGRVARQSLDMYGSMVGG